MPEQLEDRHRLKAPGMSSKGWPRLCLLIGQGDLDEFLGWGELHGAGRLRRWTPTGFLGYSMLVMREQPIRI